MATTPLLLAHFSPSSSPSFSPSISVNYALALFVLVFVALSLNKYMTRVFSDSTVFPSPQYTPNKHHAPTLLPTPKSSLFPVTQPRLKPSPPRSATLGRTVPLISSSSPSDHSDDDDNLSDDM